MHKKNTSGFTLLEIMVVIFLIALASSMAIPYVKRYIKDRQKREFIQDFLGLVSAIRSYHLMHNDWPADTKGNQLPGVLAPFLPDKFRLPVGSDGIINIKTVRPFGFPSTTDDVGAWDWDNWFTLSSEGLRLSLNKIENKLSKQEIDDLIASLNDGTNSFSYDTTKAGGLRFQCIFNEACASEPGP